MRFKVSDKQFFKHEKNEKARSHSLKCLLHEILFLRKYLAYQMLKPVPIEKKFKKPKTRFFRALKCSYFVLKCPVDW